MNSSIDTSQLLKTYESIRKDLALTNASKSIKNLNDAFEHISRREMQLNYIIEISEKLINRIESGQDSAILNKYMTEIKNLRLEVQKLEKNQGANNLFTVEVYQTELEELKKDYSDKVKNLESN